MFRSIVVATDGTDLSDHAVTTAARLAVPLGAQLTAVTVVEPYAYGGVGESSAIAGADHQASIGAQASARLAHARDVAAAAGCACGTSMQESVEVHRGLLTAVQRHEADLIVMASHGRSGVTALLLGSETQKVLSASTVPVLVVR